MKAAQRSSLVGLDMTSFPRGRGAKGLKNTQVRTKGGWKKKKKKNIETKGGRKGGERWGKGEGNSKGRAVPRLQ